MNVVLVNEQDIQLGIMEKLQAHQEGLLHRAFSVFIFNSKGEMLLQQRSSNKYHSPNLWSNACCSHPMPGENTEAAAHRRLQEELGFDTTLQYDFNFTYKVAFDNGLIEHEFDHVFTGTYDGSIVPNSLEVKDYCFMKMEDIENSMLTHPHKYSEWFKIAFEKMQKNKLVADFY